jgi:hypothetical protein
MSELDKQTKGDDLDRVLDTALAKYAAIEPRTGLEERILANLRSGEVPAANSTWWKWSLAAAVAAVLLVAIAVAWRPRSPSLPVIANHPAPAQRTEPRIEAPIEAAGRDSNAIAQRPRSTALRRKATAVAVPKLDQFPSPQPLSEQEQILASYVARFHDQAVMVARVADQQLEKDRTEIFGNPQSTSRAGEHDDQKTTNE